MPGLMDSGRLKSNPILPRTGGLERIHEGMDYQKQGKVSSFSWVLREHVLTGNPFSLRRQNSAQKLVYSLL